jgi:hypothetical protein
LAVPARAQRWPVQALATLAAKQKPAGMARAAHSQAASALQSQRLQANQLASQALHQAGAAALVAVPAQHREAQPAAAAERVRPRVAGVAPDRRTAAESAGAPLAAASPARTAASGRAASRVLVLRQVCHLRRASAED